MTCYSLAITKQIANNNVSLTIAKIQLFIFFLRDNSHPDEN